MAKNGERSKGMSPARGMFSRLAFLSLLLLFFTPALGAEVLSLPAPSLKGEVSVEEALRQRRTCRSFSTRALTLAQLSQVLWGAYGVTAKRYGLYFKTAPSAGALYPLDIYVLAGEGSVKGLTAGVYHYVPEDHGLEPVRTGDRRREAARNSFGQMWLARAPVLLVITGEYARSTVKYGPRGVIYTRIEAGHVGQNVFLQAGAMGLAAGIVGAFDNAGIVKTVGCSPGHDPLLIMAVGHPGSR